MAALITLEQAKIQLRLPLDSTEFDDDLELKIEQATAIVIRHIKRPDHGWLAGSPNGPGSPQDDLEFAIVQAAILEVTQNLFRNRGDQAVDGPLTERVKQMLIGLRDPTLA